MLRLTTALALLAAGCGGGEQAAPASTLGTLAPATTTGVVTTSTEPGTVTDLLAVTPGSGPAEGGTIVTLIAKGLTSIQDTTVLFGDVAADVKNVDADGHTVIVEAPAGSVVFHHSLTVHLAGQEDVNEAAVKYFLLGAFSLGILLYGMSLLYGLIDHSLLLYCGKAYNSTCLIAQRVELISD